MHSKITLMSFGFKYGMPNANYYFDVGFIKNPARESKWGFFSAVTDEMREYVAAQPFVQEFLTHVIPMIEFLATIDQHQVIAFGCSAGRHRSFVLVDILAKRLKEKGILVEIRHRDAGME